MTEHVGNRYSVPKSEIFPPELNTWLERNKDLFGNLASRSSRIDPYHAAAILDSKRGWTFINIVLKIYYAFQRSRVRCLCPSSLVSNQKWRPRDKGLLRVLQVP